MLNNITLTALKFIFYRGGDFLQGNVCRVRRITRMRNAEDCEKYDREKREKCVSSWCRMVSACVMRCGIRMGEAGVEEIHWEECTVC